VLRLSPTGYQRTRRSGYRQGRSIASSRAKEDAGPGRWATPGREAKPQWRSWRRLARESASVDRIELISSQSILFSRFCIRRGRKERVRGVARGTSHEKGRAKWNVLSISSASRNPMKTGMIE
jgi:hypothetical protein